MLLTTDQRDMLALLLQEQLSGNFFGPAAAALFGAEVLRKMRRGLNPFQEALAFIRHAEADRTPELFIKIVRAANRSGILVEEQVLADRLQRGELAWGGKADAQVLWMPTDRPFTDRTELRSVLQSIANGTGPPAIAIEAPAGHGKKTMGSYIEECAQRNSVVAVVEQLAKGGDGCMVDYLVYKLRQSIKSSSEVRSSDPRRQARLLAVDAVGSGVPTWFVVNLQGNEQDEGVLDFVDELLRLVREDQEIARGLRMTVLADDLRGTGLANLPDSGDRYTLPEITCVELEEWFALAAPGMPKEKYVRAAAMVLDRVDAWNPGPQRRLQFVAMHCAAAHQHLTEVSDGQR